MKRSCSETKAPSTAPAWPSRLASPQPTWPSSVSTRTNIHRGGTLMVSMRAIFMGGAPNRALYVPNAARDPILYPAHPGECRDPDRRERLTSTGLPSGCSPMIWVPAFAGMSGAGMGADQRHLLVVDDDDRLRELLRQFLARAGFRVSVAQDAAAARKMLGLPRRSTCLVVDVMMPGEDGFSLTRWIRARNPHPHPDPHRPRRTRRPHRGPVHRRRRLPAQAVRAAGAAAAHRGDPAPRRGPLRRRGEAGARHLRLRPRLAASCWKATRRCA